MSKVEKLNDAFFQDIRELCICCAQGVVVIAKRYNYNPADVSKLFLEVYTKINNDVENS
jgi:hypothetical protein